MNFSFLFKNSIINNITQAMLNGEGGVSTLDNEINKSFASTVFAFIADFIENAFLTIYTLFMKLVIIIGRFVLNVVDFALIFVRQFIGMEAEYSSLESLTNDKIFDFIFNETIIKVIKYVIIIGLVLIILFSIIAILKAEYGNVSGADNSKKHVFVNALKSCFLMVIIPVVCIISLICSNAVLSTLYMATNGGDDISVGTYIWRASTYQANAYRSYANDDNKIPITFNFTNSNSDGSSVNLNKINTDGTISDLEDSLIAFRNQNAFIKGVSTWVMFSYNSFLSIDDVENLENSVQANDKNSHSAYYGVYDNNLYFKKVEYYVMADAIDYCLTMNNNVSGGFFFKSINDVYENHCMVYGVDRVTDLPIEKVQRNGVTGYLTRVHYDGEDSETEYFSPINTYDEKQGTVYTLCYSELVTTKNENGEDVEQELLIPFINRGDFGFYSDYCLGSGSLVIARGVFDQKGYPTAIRTTDMGNIQFYRENLYSPTLLDLFPTITYELPEGQKQSWQSWLLRTGFETITGIDSDELIPYFYFTFDLFSIFSKVESKVVQLNSGNFTINYNMTGALNTYNIYKESKVNPIVLLFGAVLLLKTLVTIAFGLIARIFDMVALAITYPGVVSTLPIDGGGALSSWTEMFINRLITIYGITVSLNFILLIMPTIWGMEFFTPKMIADTLSISLVTSGWTASFLNLLVNTMFTLVAFSMILYFSRWLNFMLSDKSLGDVKKIAKRMKVKYWERAIASEDPKDRAFQDVVGATGVLDTGADMMNEAKNIAITTGMIVSGKAALQVVDNVLGPVDPKTHKRQFSRGALADFIPGAPAATIIRNIQEQASYHNTLRANSRNRENYRNDLNSGISNQNDLADRHNKFVKSHKEFKPKK